MGLAIDRIKEAIRIRPVEYVPIEGSLYTLTVDSTAGGVTIPGRVLPRDAVYAEGYVRTASVVETRDNTLPTTTLGTQWDATSIIILRSRREIERFRAIRQGGTSATIDLHFYRRA